MTYGEGKMVLETVRLVKSTIVRPADKGGTMGFHPKAWQVAEVYGRESPITAFLKSNKNWTRDEVTMR
jgi:hypothetical protein